MLETVRDHWRITLLVVVILGATVTLFAPQFAPDQEISGQQASEGLTNLQYGLDLAGGTRIRAPLLGHTAENAAIGDADVGQVATAVAEELPGTSVTDVNVELRPTREEDSRPADIEVTDAEVSREQFETALGQAGYGEYDQIRQGVTEETREAAVNVVQGKVDEAGLSGGSARQVRDEVSGQHFILVEVPGEGRQDVIDLLEQRGTVRIDIYYPDGSAEDGYSRDRGVLTSDDFDNIGTAARDEQSRPYVPLSVVNTETNPGAAQFEDAAANPGCRPARRLDVYLLTGACRGDAGPLSAVGGQRRGNQRVRDAAQSRPEHDERGVVTGPAVPSDDELLRGSADSVRQPSSRRAAGTVGHRPREYEFHLARPGRRLPDAVTADGCDRSVRSRGNGVSPISTTGGGGPDDRHWLI
jgi:hypothetical protein